MKILKAIVEALGIIKTLLPVFAVTFMQWLRIQKSNAEKRQAFAEMKNRIQKKEQDIEKDSSDINDVIDKFLRDDDPV
jgi:cell division protein FtsB